MYGQMYTRSIYVNTYTHNILRPTKPFFGLGSKLQLFDWHRKKKSVFFLFSTQNAALIQASNFAQLPVVKCHRVTNSILRPSYHNDHSFSDRCVLFD